MRICSGKFERGMDAYHVQGGRKLKLATGTSMMADDRAIVDEAYAGDIVGLFDPGIFSIGDTVCTGKQHVQFPPIPTFAPEHFAKISQVDTLKRKQFVKGMEELAQEGAVQIFRELGAGMESAIVGVVACFSLRCSSSASRASTTSRSTARPFPTTPSVGLRGTWRSLPFEAQPDARHLPCPGHAWRQASALYERVEP